MSIKLPMSIRIERAVVFRVTEGAVIAAHMPETEIGGTGRSWMFQPQYLNYVADVGRFAAEHQIWISTNPVVSAPGNEGR